MNFKFPALCTRRIKKDWFAWGEKISNSCLVGRQVKSRPLDRGCFNLKSTKKRLRNSIVGYTLIEVVIALAITSTAFVAIYALFARAMQSDAESRYEVTAAALSQEGIEMIKNKRENNEMKWSLWKNGDTLLTAFDGISALSGCNPQLNLVTAVFSCVGVDIQYSTASGEYEANCNNNCVGPVFERSCETSEIDTDLDSIDDSLRAVCAVKWKSLLLGGTERMVRTETILTDWQR